MLDTADFDLLSSTFDRATLQVDLVDGGGNVSLSLFDSSNGGAETIVFNDFFVSGLAFTGSARAAFAARTGGAYDHHDIDNVVVDWDFEGGLLGDTNGDNVVDIVDLNNVRNNFGATLPANAVPEPGSLALATVAAVGLVVTARRRRK